MPGTTDTLWTRFNNRKIGAERAIKDAKGRNLADSIDKIPTTYVSGATLSNSNKTLTLTVTDQSTSPSTTSTVSLTDTGDANVQADWAETDTTSDSYIANKPSQVNLTGDGTYITVTDTTGAVGVSLVVHTASYVVN